MPDAPNHSQCWGNGDVNKSVKEMGRTSRQIMDKKMTAKTKRIWFTALGPILRAASVNGKMPMLHDKVVQMATISPKYETSEGIKYYFYEMTTNVPILKECTFFVINKAVIFIHR